MLIEVTANDIELGVRDACCLCPVALAIARATLTDAAVAFGIVRLGDYSYQLPQRVCDFVDEFDSGFEVKPFSFYLPLGEDRCES